MCTESDYFVRGLVEWKKEKKILQECMKIFMVSCTHFRKEDSLSFSKCVSYENISLFDSLREIELWMCGLPFSNREVLVVSKLRWSQIDRWCWLWIMDLLSWLMVWVIIWNWIWMVVVSASRTTAAGVVSCVGSTSTDYTMLRMLVIVM